MRQHDAMETTLGGLHVSPWIVSTMLATIPLLINCPSLHCVDCLHVLICFPFLHPNYCFTFGGINVSNDKLMENSTYVINLQKLDASYYSKVLIRQKVARFSTKYSDKRFSDTFSQ